MTGQALLDTMELLNQELQLQSGETDVTRGLLALNIAQDFFEMQLVGVPNMYGSGTGTFTQTNGVELTAIPTGLLRIDRLQYLDPATSRPARTLQPRFQVGSHAPSSQWLASMQSSSSTGKPVAYFTNGTSIYWDPLPDSSANIIRYYGLVAAADITAGGTFTYTDYARLPLATFAVSLMKLGVDDDPSTLHSLAQNLFGGVLKALGSFNRSGAVPLEYAYDHR